MPQPFYIGIAVLFALLVIAVGGLALWGYRRRASLAGEWWPPLIQVPGHALLALHFALVAARAPARDSPLAEATLWYGLAALWCWAVTAVGLSWRDRRRGSRGG